MISQQKFSFDNNEEFNMLLMKSEMLIHSIVGPSRTNTYPFAYSIAVTAIRLYVQKIQLCDFAIYKDVYFQTAKQLKQKHASVARNIERAAKLILRILITHGITEKYLGRIPNKSVTPRVLIIYLAAYIYFDRPYHRLFKDSSDELTAQYFPI